MQSSGHEWVMSQSISLSTRTVFAVRRTHTHTHTHTHTNTTHGTSPLQLSWMSHVSQYISIATVMHESCLTAYLFPLSLYSQWDTTHICVALSISTLWLSCTSPVSQKTSIHSHCVSLRHDSRHIPLVTDMNESRLTVYFHYDCHAWVTSHSIPLFTLTVFTVRHSEILSCECSECKWVAQYISMEIYCETMPMNLSYIVHTSWQWRCIECEWVMNCANELWQWRSMHYDNDDALNANEWVSLKLQVSFAKEPYKRDDILQKRPIIWRSLRCTECECVMMTMTMHWMRMNEYIFSYIVHNSWPCIVIVMKQYIVIVSWHCHQCIVIGTWDNTSSLFRIHINTHVYISIIYIYVYIYVRIYMHQCITWDNTSSSMHRHCHMRQYIVIVYIYTIYIFIYIRYIYMYLYMYMRHNDDVLSHDEALMHHHETIHRHCHQCMVKIIGLFCKRDL